MRNYLLPKDGRFYKANLHCHTTFSDGRKTPAEIKELYARLGYSVVAITDHDLLIPHDELTDSNFLALHGFEIEVNEKGRVWEQKKCCHLCMIALEGDNITQPCWHRSKYGIGNAPEHRGEVKFDENEPDFVRTYSHEGVNEMIRRGREKGFFVTYNHPAWSMERYPDYSGYEGMNAMEIMNSMALAEGYEDYNPRVYDDFLSAGRLIYCIGADDNHNAEPDSSCKSESGRAFTMIKSGSLDYRSITAALEAGSFYASQGPLIKELWTENGEIFIRTDSAESIHIVRSTRANGRAFREPGKRLTQARFQLREDDLWFRLVVTDKYGRHACTNAYPVP